MRESCIEAQPQRFDSELRRRDFLRAVSAAGLGALVASHAAVASAHQPPQTGEGVFSLGDFRLKSGTILPNTKIAYKTHGQLNTDKNNAILYPTQIAAQHGDIELMIGPGRALDPDRYFIIVLDQLGNGVSSSPSNTPSLERALGAIRAKTTVMASRTDLYFTPDDVEAEAVRIPGAQFRTIPSLWGHMAGAGLNPADNQLIEAEIKALLAS